MLQWNISAIFLWVFVTSEMTKKLVESAEIKEDTKQFSSKMKIMVEDW